MGDPHDLRRFLDAQEPVIDEVRRELQTGRKTSHWMWFVFPQIAGLGRSETARFYAISSREEAVAYLEHPVLGARLRECATLVTQIEDRTAHQIFGSPDDLKLRSCMTLFASVSRHDPVFADVLSKYYEGKSDSETLRLLEQS